MWLLGCSGFIAALKSLDNGSGPALDLIYLLPGEFFLLRFIKFVVLVLQDEIRASVLLFSATDLKYEQ